MREARLSNSAAHLLGGGGRNLIVYVPKSCSSLSHQTKVTFHIQRLSYSRICGRYFCHSTSWTQSGCGSYGAGPQGDLIDCFISVYKFSSTTYRLHIIDLFYLWPWDNARLLSQSCSIECCNTAIPSHFFPIDLNMPYSTYVLMLSKKYNTHSFKKILKLS